MKTLKRRNRNKKGKIYATSRINGFELIKPIEKHNLSH